MLGEPGVEELGEVRKEETFDSAASEKKKHMQGSLGRPVDGGLVALRKATSSWNGRNSEKRVKTWGIDVDIDFNALTPKNLIRRSQHGPWSILSRSHQDLDG